MRQKECPKCGADISDSFVEYDPSVGVMGQGWYCEVCDLFVDDDDDGSDYYDYERDSARDNKLIHGLR